MVHEDMPNDVARALTCTIYAHRESLLKISAVAKSMTVDNIRKLSAVPLHNGTLEYLEDTGVACGAGLMKKILVTSTVALAVTLSLYQIWQPLAGFLCAWRHPL